MKITFMNDFGQTFTVEIDPGMELENVMALLEAESGVPVAEQGIHLGDRELTDPKKTMQEYGIPDDSVLILRRKGVNVGGRAVEQDAETMRLQILGDPHLLRQLREAQPELAAAAQSNPARFAELLRQTRERQIEAELQRQREIERLNDDPFDIEAQRRIEEHIRQEAVLENMQHALEWSPESFGRVTMLYIPVEVNSHPVKAFVDSGAQQTISKWTIFLCYLVLTTVTVSPECAEACGLMRLVDKRFAGIARGVGTASILGRVHSAQLKLADLFLPCSFTIMEGRDVDLLFGLDMLKAHQACIDLEKNVLRIQGREVRFLSEHELPDKARFFEVPPGETTPSNPGTSGSGSSRPASGRAGNSPGSGQALGSAPGPRPPAQPAASASTNRYPESAISTLTGLGVSREEAIRVLELAGGNVDMAASLLF
ncbi:DNA damage-inducible protein 1 [Leucoagaricus sp. SymC.cos]|nr:DNA damage-inducible protein 1 [Leucoagaricus sp. SymC.cos]